MGGYFARGLSNVSAVTGMPRKSLIRAFANAQKHSNWKAPPKLGRPKEFTAETEAALAFVWEQYDYPCAERLHPQMVEAVRILTRDGMGILQTPYQRVLARNDIDQIAKDKLFEQYETLNPKVLRETIQALTSKLQRIQREQGYHY